MSDELDRLFRALVLRVRDVRPENLSRPFEVGDVLRTFVPYRTTRAEVGVETAEDYEVLIVRLLSGELDGQGRGTHDERFVRYGELPLQSPVPLRR